MCGKRSGSLKVAKMIDINIPGWGDMEIENIVLDLNGTIATDGKIPSEVKEKINSLSNEAKIYLLTADTQGTAGEESSDLDVELLKVSEKDSAEVKLRVMESLDPTRTVAIGNGNNDYLILKEAALSVAVLGDEGLSVSAMQNADLVVKNIADALDLFLKPKRLTATLRV
jgi:soluble P-type ATPase